MKDASIQVLIENHARFRRFVARKIGSAAVAEELIQEGMVRAIQSRAVRKNESIVSWFYAILRNLIIDHYRASASEQKKKNDFLRLVVANEEATSPAVDSIRNEICKCIAQLLPELNAGYSRVLRMVDLEGQKPADVAAELKMTRNHLTVTLHRARQALRRRLEQSCGSCTRHGCLDCDCRR